MRRKLYKHIIDTDFLGIRTKIKNFVKPRVTTANNTKIFSNKITGNGDITGIYLNTTSTELYNNFIEVGLELETIGINILNLNCE